MKAGIEGIEVIVTELAMGFEIIRPKDRFIEYGPEDDWWLKKNGLLRYGPMEPTCFMWNGKMMAHPVIVERLKLREKAISK